MIDSAQKRAVVEAYVGCHSAGDVDGILALFAEDARAYDPVGSPAHEGAEGIRAFFAGTHEMVDKLTLTLTGPVRAVAGSAAFPMVARSEMGEMILEIDIIDVFEFNEDGKISEMRAYWDMAEARAVTE